jgi:mono/diheme cytochrome c family protein
MSAPLPAIGRAAAATLLAAMLAAPSSVAADSLAPAALHDYVLSCAGCHKLDGTGSARVPTLHGTARLLERTGGRDYLLRVPGASQAPLSDARLAALLNWVLAEFGGAAPVPPFTAEEVAAARATPLRDPQQARAALR